MTYSSIGLDSNLNAVNGLAGRAKLYTDSATFDAWFELPSAYLKAENLATGNLQFITNIAWTAVSATVATWAAGTIEWASGSSSYVAAGTANLTADSYVYFAGGTALNTSITYSDSVGDDRTLLAILTKSTGTDKCLIKTVGGGGDTFTASKIVAGTISANLITGGTMSANYITGGTFTAALGLGGANVTIDGANNRIVINDGTVNRIYFGSI